MCNTGNALAAILFLLYFSSPCIASSANAIPRPFGRVAVVSLLGTTLHALRQGILVFGNKEYSVEVPDWGIDRDTTDFLKSTLEADGYSASVLSIAPQRADELYDQSRVPVPNYERMRKLAAEQGFDTLIVVARDTDAHSNLIKPGFGLYVLIKAVFPYAALDMRVEDVKTGKRLAFDFEGATEAYPDKALVWKDKFDSYSDEQRERIRSGIEDHIHKNLLRMLANKRIIPTDQKP